VYGVSPVRPTNPFTILDIEKISTDLKSNRYISKSAFKLVVNWFATDK
jgi:hypothetical protein